MLRKLIRLGWIGAVLYLAAGCGSTAVPRGQGYMAELDNRDSEGIMVGFSQIGEESDWRIANTESIRDSFQADDGFYLIVEDAQQKQEKQIKALRNFILQKVDYIVLNPIVETGWDAVFEEAKEAGIPVILADRRAAVDEELYSCWIGSDFVQEARNAGEWLAAYLETQGRSDETINIVTLQGTPQSSAQLGRTEGFALAMEDHPNWKMLDMQNGDFIQTKGEEIMAHYLEEYQEIDVVISENDNMTFGAIDAIKEAGKTCGPDGDIIIISFDAVRSALEAMMAGDINADFECNPLQGPKIKEIIQAMEAGETVDKIQYMEETYFDSSMDLKQLMKKRTY